MHQSNKILKHKKYYVLNPFNYHILNYEGKGVIFLERDFTIFYGVYIVLNIMLIGILLGATNQKVVDAITPDPIESVQPLEPSRLHLLNIYTAEKKPSFTEYQREKSQTEPEETTTPETEEPAKPDQQDKTEPPTAEPPTITRPVAPIVYSGSSTKKRVAITFDDGPDPRTLIQMLDILDEYNVSATFFLLGRRVNGAEHLVKEIYDRGHQIANHSYSHPKFSILSWSESVREIEHTEEALGKYMSHKYFRPPYGDYKRETLQIAHSLGYRVIYWNVDTRDWAASNPKQIVDAVKKNTKPGSIILFHEGKNLTIQALPEILEWLTQEGYQFVTVAELLGE